MEGREFVKDSAFANGEKTQARAEAQLSLRKQKRQEKLRKGRELTTFDANSKAPVPALMSRYNILALVKDQKHEQLAILRGILQQIDGDQLNQLYVRLITPEVLNLLTKLSFGNFGHHSMDAIDCLIVLTWHTHHFEIKQAAALFQECNFLNLFLQRLLAPSEPSPQMENKMWFLLSNILITCHETTADIMRHPLMTQHFFPRANHNFATGDLLRCEGIYAIICGVLRKSNYKSDRPLPFDLQFAVIALQYLKQYFFLLPVENIRDHSEDVAEKAIECVNRTRNAFQYFLEEGAEKLLEAIDARVFLVKLKSMYFACGSDLRTHLPRETLGNVQFACISFASSFIACRYPVDFDISDFFKSCGALQLVKAACNHMHDSSIRRTALVAYGNYVSSGFQYIVEEINDGLFNLIRSSLESGSMPIKEAASYVVVQVVIVCQTEREKVLQAQNVIRRLVEGDKVLNTLAELVDIERFHNYTLAADAVTAIYYCVMWNKEVTLAALEDAVGDPEELLFRVSMLAHQVKEGDVGDDLIYQKMVKHAEKLLSILQKENSIMDLSEYDSSQVAPDGTYVGNFKF